LLKAPNSFGPVRPLVTVADDGSRWRVPVCAMARNMPMCAISWTVIFAGSGPLNLGTAVVYFGARGVILNVLRGHHERLAARHVDCAGAMAAR
jgi:hypothetical protein